LDKDISIQAKKYAKKKMIPLSKLIESYLAKVSSGEQQKPVISPLVKGFYRIITLPKDHDSKKSYGDFLAAKYKFRYWTRF
jgi:hypothetical protein